MPSSPRDATAKPPARAAAWAKQALVWVVGAGLLGWLLLQVPLDVVHQALAAPSPQVWALTLGGLALSYLARAARLQVVLGLHEAAPHGPRVAGLRVDALRVILMHNAAVNLLPMRAGELSFPWLASRHLHMPLARSVASLMWMRLQDLAVLAALGLLLWPDLALPWRAGGLVLIVAGWHVGVWLLGLLARRPAAGASGWGQRLSSLQQALAEPHHHRPAAWALTWANWSVKLAVGAALLAAITQAPYNTALAGALGGELAAVVPLQGPAGFGTYEAGVWAGLALNLVPGSTMLMRGVPAALALHLCLLLCSVLAGTLAWLTPSWVTPRLPG